ncbi:MAG: hypothetical protein ABI743_11705, partial [bacterium]
MRHVLGATAVTLLLAAIGCNSSAVSPTHPAGNAMLPQPTLGDLEGYGGDLAQAVVGIFHVRVDPSMLTGSVELVAQRDAQQGALYNLSIGNFLKPNSFEVTGVSGSATTVDIHYTTRHPFPAPSDLGGAPSGSNRGDLAVTGRVLWLLDSPEPATYFAGDGNVRLNARMVTNPAGYFTPGGLLDTTGLTANTFPYQLLVDEVADNREGFSNGGIMRGNYGGAGWQIAEFQAGLTGYGIWAQGTSSTHTLSLNKALLANGEIFEADAAVVVKYQDPRGGTTGA